MIKQSSIKSSRDKDCDLSWLNKIYKCKNKSKDEVELYAKECNIDTKVFKTKDQICKELYKIQNPENRKSSPRKSSPRKSSPRKSSPRKSSPRKSPIKSYNKNNEFKIIEFTPYSQENDIFYNQEKIKVNYIGKIKKFANPEKNSKIKYSEYDYLQQCIEYNDTKSFKEFIEKNPETNIFFYPENRKNLLSLAIDYSNQEIVNIITDLEMKYRKRGKDTCYQVYSYKYLKLLESMSTEESPVDFYIEEWLFSQDYKLTEHQRKKELASPMQMLYYENCFWKRTNRDKQKCLYPNIRWQSGDIRKIFINKFIKSISEVIEAFLQYNKLYLDDFKSTLKEFLPFLQYFSNDYTYMNLYIDDFIEINPILKKEFSKQENKEVILSAIQKYVSALLTGQKSQYLDYFLAVLNQNAFPRYKKGPMPVLKEKNFRYNYNELLEQKKTPKNIEEYHFCNDINFFLVEIIKMTSFMMDIYTILRIFKKTDVKPYFVYCYFGHKHIKDMLYFFTEILGWYNLIIYKENTSCNENDISPDKNCRCISFDEKEYIENSKEIRQLSGPISFYRLEAKDENTRPRYITLFGDDHSSERGQCKECNFDYIVYNQ